VEKDSTAKPVPDKVMDVPPLVGASTALETSEQGECRAPPSLCVGRMKGCLATEWFIVAEKRLQIPREFE
jgi:hypothetical protein